MFALGLADRLDQSGKVLVVRGDFLEGGGVGDSWRIGVDGDVEVVDCVALFLREGVVGWVDADGVGDGDGRDGEDVGLDGGPDVREVENVGVEDL